MGFFENDTCLNSSENLIVQSVNVGKKNSEALNTAVFLPPDNEKGWFRNKCQKYFRQNYGSRIYSWQNYASSLLIIFWILTILHE